MRLLRLFLISIISLFVVVLAISLFIPSKVRISRATNIRATPAQIFRQLDDMDNWPRWNPFFESVSPGSIERIDTSSGRLNAMRINGTSISWQEKNDSLRIARMERPGKKNVTNGWNLVPLPHSDSTAVQWYMEFNLRWYPWEKFGSLLFDRSYGVQIEQGLVKLKQQSESDRTSQ